MSHPQHSAIKGLNSFDLVTDAKVTITTKHNPPVFSLEVLFAYVGHTEASVLN